MLHYCLKCIKKRESKNPKVANKNKEKLMFLSKCAVFDSKKLRFIKKARTGRVVKYDWLNSNTWSVIKIIIDKNCCDPDVFI